MRLSWANFKSFVDNRGVPIHERPLDDGNLLLEAWDGPIARSCKLRNDEADYTDYTTNYQSAANPTLTDSSGAVVYHASAFANKKLPNGKKLYKRVHGQSAAVSTTQSSHKFTVPYTSCKITGVEIIGAEEGDFVDFNILDTTTGTVSTIPNYKLNQFGFNVYMAQTLHKEISNYDADLFVGLQIEVLYTSISSKTVYFNYILHELKD